MTSSPLLSLGRSLSKLGGRNGSTSRLLSGDKLSIEDDMEIRDDEFTWPVKMKSEETPGKKVDRILAVGPEGLRILVPTTNEELGKYPYAKMKEYTYNAGHRVFQFSWLPSKTVEETIFMTTNKSKEIHETIGRFLTNLLRDKKGIKDAEKILNDCTYQRPPEVEKIKRGGTQRSYSTPSTVKKVRKNNNTNNSTAETPSKNSEKNTERHSEKNSEKGAEKTSERNSERNRTHKSVASASEPKTTPKSNKKKKQEDESDDDEESSEEADYESPPKRPQKNLGTSAPSSSSSPTKPRSPYPAKKIIEESDDESDDDDDDDDEESSSESEEKIARREKKTASANSTPSKLRNHPNRSKPVNDDIASNRKSQFSQSAPIRTVSAGPRQKRTTKKN